jgi:GxxExxY protein
MIFSTQKELTGAIIACAIEVHRELGPGLLESVYQACIEEELRMNDINFVEQLRVPIVYKGKKLDKEFVIDLLVENQVVIELKAVEIIMPVHEVQLVTYLKLADKKIGLLINFNVPVLKEGVRRRVNNL